MKSYLIRECNLGDLNYIFDIDQGYEFERYSIETIKSSLTNDNYYNILIEVDEKIIGYLSAIKVVDECELLKIVIDKNYRGNGYGKLLISSLKEYCKSNHITKIFLEVREDNFTARALYEKCGFVKTSTREGYYNGINAELYWCDIND